MVASRDTYRIVIDVDVKDRQQLKGLEQNLKELGKSAPAATNKLNKGLRKTQIEMRQTGRALQNASYQIQDFIVQVTGGVDPLRSFSQQAPQLLINMGALGAAVGVVAAGLPILISSLREASEEFAGLDNSLDSLNEELSKSAEISTSVDFTSWARAFKEMDEQAKLLASSILDVRIQLQEIRFEEALEAFTGFVDVIVPGTKLADIQLSSMAKNLGLTVGELEKLMPLIQDFRNNPFGDPAVLEEIVNLLQNAGTQALPLLEKLKALKDAQQSIQEGSLAAGGEGPAFVEETKKNVEELADFIEVRATRIRSNMANMALPIEERALIEQFEEDRAALNDFSNNVVNEFSVAGEAISIFTRTSETALNGLAMGTQSLSDAFTNMVKSIIAQLGKLLALKGIEMLFPSLQGMLVTPSAKGNAFMNGSVTAFAKGGVVSSPTIFPMAKGVGLMGEAGSPEAIMPLTRTSSGNLGVEATGMNVTVNNMSPAQIRTTQTDSGVNIDVIMDTIASAVQRGGNNVADALESTYPISRGQRVY